MSTNTLRIRFLSLKDAANQPFSKTILYVKKLAQVSTSAEFPMKLKEKDPKSSVVLAFNETYDMFPDDEMFQILFLLPRTNIKVMADFIFRRDYLIDRYVNSPREERYIQPELLCHIELERNYTFEFSLQLLKDNQPAHQLSKNRLIRDHVMLSEQFNQPTSCALCNKLIWGVYHQGYKCSQCSFVIHRKCYQYIPFTCPKSSSSNSNRLIESDSCEYPRLHVFIRYRVPFIQSLLSSEDNYCHHCGSQVLQHARKCTQCPFIIHKHCQSNIPPMCGTPYMLAGNNQSRSTPPRSPAVSEESISESEDTNHPPNGAITLLPRCSDFKCLGHLGSGRYGNVYCVQHRSSKKYFAIKVVDGSEEQARHQSFIERDILFRYNHINPYTIQAYCSFHHGSHLFLVMEFADGDRLDNKMNRTSMNESEIKFYLAELISALQYLHSNQIIYRDLKLENIIINSAGHLRLIDYGLGRILKTADETCQTICGTHGYLAPEILCLEQQSTTTTDGYNYSVDYWALGVVFAQMLCGRKFDFYDHLMSSATVHRRDPLSVIHENLQSSCGISSEARSCLDGLLEVDPKKRFGSPISPHGWLREHPFFKVRDKIDWHDIDQGLSKSMYKQIPTIETRSTTSIDMPFSRLLFDRSAHAKDRWITAGQSTCSPDEDAQFRAFDCVNEPTWSEFIN